MDGRTAIAATAGAVIGASLATAAAYAYQHYSRPAGPPGPQPEASTSQPAATPGSQASVRRFADDDILAEQLTRNVQFFGREGQQRIADAFVVVVGLGGVGSHAAHLLLRSGVGKLRLVDFDQVTLSSLNRHAVAMREDVGVPKAVCLQRHFARILPEADVECVVSMFTEETAEQLLSGQPSFVIDAIDNIDTKVALLAACKQRGIPVLCVAGAGAKADPTRVRFVDISESSYDPLARAVRHKLARGRGIRSGIPVLLSTEKPRCGLVSMYEEEMGGQQDLNPLDYQLVPNFRVGIIPVLGTTPAVFGMAAAGYVLCELAKAPFEGEPIIRLQQQQYTRALERLEERERERYGDAEGVAVELADVMYLVRELWRGLSAHSQRVVMPGGDKGLMRSTANLTLTRWDASRPATVDNLVLLTFDEADAHDKLQDSLGPGPALQQLARESPEFYARVETALQRARHDYAL